MEIGPKEKHELKKDWVVTQAAFDKLLDQLGADRADAAKNYERLRQKLMKFFRWRGCALSEEYADKTIDRVARRIQEGAEIHAQDPYVYFHGVALNVLREHWKEVEREKVQFEKIPSSHNAAENPSATKEREAERNKREERLECLNECVLGLPPQYLELITEYHHGEGGPKIERRKELARRLKIELNALRIRAYRIRGELETCVVDCLRRAKTTEG